MSQFRLQSAILPLIYCLFFQQSTALPAASIWDVHIFNGPAPSPQDGPPASANATRDKAYLPYELASIFGSYLVVVIILSVAILTVGRRLRRSAQGSPTTLNMDLVKPSLVVGNQTDPYGPSPISPTKSNQFGPSPVSPTKANQTWPSPKPTSGWGSMRKHQKQDSVQSSVLTFDDSVIEEDRSKNEIEMDRLYAAVAEHENKKEKGPDQPLSPLAQHPPELQHLKRGPAPLQFPLSPPPDQQSFSQSRTSTTSPRRLNKPTPISINNPPSRNSSRSSFASFASFGKKRNTSIRALPISPPMGSPDMAPDNRYGESEPLTPRHYTPGPPPTPPHRDVLHSPHFAPSIRSSRSSNNGYLSPPLQTPRSATFGPIQPPPAIVEEQSRPGFALTVDGVAAAPDGRSEAPLSHTGKGRKPQALKLANSNDSSGTLSLRTAPLPLRALRSPKSTRPPSMIRATELTRPDPHRLMAPGSAMPQTPYSPFYMPQTPLTPMTPSRLVTREERKRAQKAEGRRVLTADDAVQEENEMWGEGY